MPDTEVVEAAPLTPAQQFVKTREEMAAKRTPEAIAARAGEAAAATGKPGTPAAAEPQKRASGDERKFRRALSKRDQEIGELRAKIEALTPKAAAAVATEVATSDAPPQRDKFASDEAFEEAKIAYQVKKELDKKTAETAQAQEIKDVLTAYNELIAKGPEKYADWNETLAAGKDGALTVDLGKECPALLWAIAKSPHADDVFYHWLKEPSKLQGLIDLYKSGPKGEAEAITAFHRFEGRVAKDAPEKKPEVKEPAKKADDAARTPRPRPSSEVTAPTGATARDGAPAIYLPGTHTINPAWKAWRRAQTARN